MMKIVKISTIIPVYNAEKYITRCLDSIINQPLEDKEIICVDDGSTDSSLAILRDYEKRFPIVRVFTQKNQYSGPARNKGLSEASGEYVHFVDADDYLYDNVYPKIYEFARKLDADYVKFRTTHFDEKTGEEYPITSKVGLFATHGLLRIKPELFGKLISIENYFDEITGSGIGAALGVIKRQFLIDNNIRFDNLKCSNDISFYYDVVTKTNKFAFLDLYVYHYQKNNPNALTSIRGDNFDCTLKSYGLVKQIVENVNEDLRKKILNKRFLILCSNITTLEKDYQKEKFKKDIIEFFVNFDWSDVDCKPNITGNKIKNFLENTTDDILENVMLLLFVNGVLPIFNVPSELMNILKRYKHIYVYGAGRCCKETIDWLKSNDIFPEKILITSLMGNPSEINGIKVEELNPEDRSLDKSEIAILITTAVWHGIIIYNQLKDAGYNNIFWTVGLSSRGGY